MFSFHKPKIYRSLHGCCICRAKSSSSRFTDSQRYETDFEKCFGIDEHRSGEICNACVLLVKRWKKLPVGSLRNWHHVVDARAGPGTKSMYKIKNRTKEMPEDHSIMKKKHKHKHRKRPTLSQLHNKAPNSPGGYSDITMGDEGFSDNYISRTPSPGNSDVSDDDMDEQESQKSVPLSVCRRRKAPSPIRISSFLDLRYWKETQTCCGIIFKGANGEVVVDPRLLHPCRSCKTCPPSKPVTRSQTVAQTTASSHSIGSKPRRQNSNSESCTSSDSGVSTPAEHSLDMSYTPLTHTPPPPTLEPELPQGELPPTHLVPGGYEDLEDDPLDEDDESFMPPVMPSFMENARNSPYSSYQTNVGNYQTNVGDLTLTDDDSQTATDIQAAAGILDLALGMRRQRFTIPMPV